MYIHKLAYLCALYLLTVKSRTRISLMSFFAITFSSSRGPSPPKGLDATYKYTCCVTISYSYIFTPSIFPSISYEN